jgi:prepilin-type N-terminal cleavage/methylation domain-containing protein
MIPHELSKETSLHGSQRAKLAASHGFSLIEIMVVVAVMMVVSAIAIPAVMESWAIYRMNSAAVDVSGILKRTRFEAIRSNTVVNCLIQQQGNNWILGADLNNNGAIDPTEPQVLLSGPVQLLPAGVAPGPTSMGYPTAQVPYPGAIAFDPRGGVNFGGNPQVVYVLYLGYTGQGRYGYRAVTVLPLATTKIWSSGATGLWRGPAL